MLARLELVVGKMGYLYGTVRPLAQLVLLDQIGTAFLGGETA